MAKEIWKDIENYDGIYQISNFGRVKSLSRQTKSGKYKEIIKKPSLAGRGYYRLALCKNGKPKYYYIHRLVAKAFIPNPNNLPLVNHKDENKLNNNVNNLEWCDSEYNMNYGFCNIKKNISRAIYYCKQNGKNDIAEELEKIIKKI